MSESVTIKIYYGTGEIIYGPQGVDLSNYSSVEKNVPRVGERTWEAITNWLVKAFSVDLEHQCMSVIALINISTPVGLAVSSQVHEEAKDVDEGGGGEEGEGVENAEEGDVTPAFPKKTKCKPICMPGSSVMHIVTYKCIQKQYHVRRRKIIRDLCFILETKAPNITDS
jgi:hypothetical protein